MSNITLNPNASGTGTFSVASPNSNTDRTLTLPDSDGELVNLDSSGNLLVGTTDAFPATNNDANGIALRADGNLMTSRSGAVTARFNRGSTDGSIVEFHKDGTTVGSIGIRSGVTSYIVLDPRSGGTGLSGGTGQILPTNTSGVAVDNVADLGASTVRWDDIYATNGTIQTSDRNEKQDIDVLSAAEQRVAQACKGLLRKFRWKDAVAEKGDDARIHFGIIAQDLQDAFAAEGLDAGRYAMFISSTWWETTETYTDDEGVEQTRTDTYETQEEAPAGATERTRLGVRYPELLAFIIGAM